MQAERITDSVAYHAEGPVWSPGWGGLRWVDMLAGDILTLSRDGSIARRNVGTVAAVVRPRKAGGAVLAVERGFALEEPDGELVTLDPLWDHDRVRMNEGGCDPDGRFYCGSMAYDRTPGAGSVWRLDPDLTVEVVLEGVTISNGLEWTPDDTAAYYVDTSTRRIDILDYDYGTGLTNRRPFAEISGPGRPDGLTVDSEGGVWVALFRGSVVRRYTPEGVLDEVIELPVSQITACTFGGPDLDQLYITTSREGLDPDEEPAAGSLFLAEAGVRGRPVREFGG